jgi:hypothetical protein
MSWHAPQDRSHRTVTGTTCMTDSSGEWMTVFGKSSSLGEQEDQVIRQHWEGSRVSRRIMSKY